MWLRCFGLILLISAYGIANFAYIGFVKRRVAAYGRTLRFLKEASRRAEEELIPLRHIFEEYFATGDAVRCGSIGSDGISRHLDAEDAKLISELLADSGSLSRTVDTIRSAETRFSQRLSELEQSSAKSIRIALTLYAGISVGAVLLFI